jgi:hypothetical protein
MKPEITAGAVLEGRPNLTRVKRLANFVAETLTSLPKPSEAMQQREFEKVDTDAQLAARGRSFLNALRQNFGEALHSGLMVRPITTDHEVLVEANTEDTELYHQTAAEVDVMSKEGHVTRLVVGATEPTRAGRRFRSDIPRQAWVRVLDTSDPTRSYDSLDYNPGEQADLLKVADTIFGEVEAACDRGDCQLYEPLLT